MNIGFNFDRSVLPEMAYRAWLSGDVLLKIRKIPVVSAYIELNGVCLPLDFSEYPTEDLEEIINNTNNELLTSYCYDCLYDFLENLLNIHGEFYFYSNLLSIVKVNSIDATIRIYSPDILSDSYTFTELDISLSDLVNKYLKSTYIYDYFNRYCHRCKLGDLMSYLLDRELL
ncbi:hypothetical protein [Sigmofec virus UA08Rod_5625]|uniref:Uncharacterized protein n=1 Tax=Sigmofec virus UA08Rod_5625 TaxID=2929432 RepID=A0A976R595_9VIRU|nr:hypothetical protein [Sigmofec virus UA08Rod_5625]